MSQVQLTATPTNIPRRLRPPGPHYKWIALSNTTLGILMATINSSIVLISLPAIFNGIGIDPLNPSHTNYLLWMLMGYMLLTATLVVSLGRISDMFGRVRMYNLGFAIFSIGSILLYITPGSKDIAATLMIGFRLVQAVGGALLMANSTAILLDAFPLKQRGMALGINQVAAILGSILGLILGGVLAAIDWRLVFLVSVPVGIVGTIWAYLMLRETAQTGKRQKIDWLGNLTFFLGLTIALIGMTYGLEPYGSSPMGWANPFVIACLVVGVLLLLLFVWIETRVEAPMFNLKLFKIVSFTSGNVANLCAGMVRGGLQFMLIIWLQGIWLPLHGYSFADTPLWAGIYMLPLMVGFFLIGPLSGVLSDRLGQRLFATSGMLVQAVCFILLTLLPANFDYIWFAVILVCMGIGQGMFSAPNTTLSLNDVPPEQRGVGSGMRATFMNASSVVSMTMFFSIVTFGLASSLPSTLSRGLMNVGLPPTIANGVSHLPPIAALFAAFLGYNPMQSMLPGQVLQQLPITAQNTLLGHSFFPNLISSPFMDGMRMAFFIAAGVCVVSAAASTIRGKAQRPQEEIIDAGAGVLNLEEGLPATVKVTGNGSHGLNLEESLPISARAGSQGNGLDIEEGGLADTARIPRLPRQPSFSQASHSNGQHQPVPASTVPVTPALRGAPSLVPLPESEDKQSPQLTAAISQLLAAAHEANMSLDEVYMEIERQKTVEERQRHLSAAVSQLLAVAHQYHLSLVEIYNEIEQQEMLHLQEEQRGD
jgi:EmrB/QacA subfamily drug resistance transporter